MERRVLERQPSLVEELKTRVRRTTHGRIRELTIEENQGLYVMRGWAPSHHTKQLALQGVLELLSGEEVLAKITVG